MKEALVQVLTGLQSLSNDDSRERPVDRLHAVGSSQRRETWDHETQKFVEHLREAHLATLGKNLISFKYAHRADAREPAVNGLADALDGHRLRLNLRRGTRVRVAAWSIQEWVVDQCPTCTGRKQIPDHDIQGLEGRQPMKPCPTCSGTGRRRYEDAERAEALGDSVYSGKLDRALSAAHGIIGYAERLAIRSAKELLEKW